MKSFKWPLLILILLTGVALAGYLAGLFPDDTRTPAGAIQVTLEQHGADRTLRIRLANADTRTHWQKSSDRYRVDIQRRGPDLYQFDIVLLAANSKVARTMQGVTQIQNGAIKLGGFSFDDRHGRMHQSVVLELR